VFPPLCYSRSTSCHSALRPRAFFLFFVLRPRPPRRTLFPYTTLFRSGRRHMGVIGRLVGMRRGAGGDVVHPFQVPLLVAPRHFRSEEHTSELQSRFDLVCRLLLEKQNKLTHRLPVRHRRYSNLTSTAL